MKVGASKVDITPKESLDLGGYIARENPSKGIHDPIYARALIFDDGEKKAAIISLDLIGLDRELSRQILKEIEKVCLIRNDHIFLLTTHNHSAPATVFFRRLGQVNKNYTNFLSKKIIQAVHLAKENKRPAKIGISRGKLEVSFNRRDPLGPVDPEVGVIYIEEPDHKPLGVLVNYTCHAVTLGSDNLLVSSDYPGYAMEIIEKDLGVISQFTNGACGDVNPRGSRTSEDAIYRSEILKIGFQLRDNVGKALACEVLRVVPAIKTKEKLFFKAASREITLPLGPIPDKEKVKELINESREKIKELKNKKAGSLNIKIENCYLAWAEDLLSSIIRGQVEKEIKIRIKALSIDNTALIAISGEPFVALGLEIKKRSKFRNTFVMGYADGYGGYIPTREEYRKGGYEVNDAFKYSDFPQGVSSDAGELIVETVIDILKELKR